MKNSLKYFAIIFCVVLIIGRHHRDKEVDTEKSTVAPTYKYVITEGYYNTGGKLYTNEITTHVSQQIEFTAHNGKTYKIPYPYYSVAEYKADNGEHSIATYKSSQNEELQTNSFEWYPRFWKIDSCERVSKQAAKL